MMVIAKARRLIDTQRPQNLERTQSHADDAVAYGDIQATPGAERRVPMSSTGSAAVGEDDDGLSIQPDPRYRGRPLGRSNVQLMRVSSGTVGRPEHIRLLVHDLHKTNVGGDLHRR